MAMQLGPNETELIGSAERRDGKIVADAIGERIHGLINAQFELVKISSNGWERLYRDPSDNRYWELFFPHGAMQGGGPQALRYLDDRVAIEKYGDLTTVVKPERSQT